MKLQGTRESSYPTALAYRKRQYWSFARHIQATLSFSYSLERPRSDRFLSNSRSLSLATYSTLSRSGRHRHHALWISKLRDIPGNLLTLYVPNAFLHPVEELAWSTTRLRSGGHALHLLSVLDDALHRAAHAPHAPTFHRSQRSSARPLAVVDVWAACFSICDRSRYGNILIS